MLYYAVARKNKIAAAEVLLQRCCCLPTTAGNHHGCRRVQFVRLHFYVYIYTKLTTPEVVLTALNVPLRRPQHRR